MNPLHRLFFVAMLRSAGIAASWAVGLLTFAGVAGVLAVVRPGSISTLGAVVAGAFAGALPVGVAVATVAGPAAALVRLGGSGWLGLSALGLRGRNLLGVAALWLGLGGVTALVVGHTVEPRARGAMRSARAMAGAELRISTGQVTVLGEWALTEDDGVRIASSDGTRVRADRARVRPTLAGVEVQLTRGEAHGDGFAVRFAEGRATVPVAASGGSVAELRTTVLLQRQLSAYERWILWKRTLLPGVLVGLGFLGMPLAARWGLSVTGAVLASGFWAAVRVSDGVVLTLGVGWTATAMVGALAIAVGGAWCTWRDR